MHVKHSRYGYRWITIKLRERDWFINFKRVFRLWCQEGLKVPRKQHKKRRGDGGSANACHRLIGACCEMSDQVREVIIRDLKQQAHEKMIEKFLDAHKAKRVIEER
ncbi:MAG: transposase [Planctomycetes bacterium]|nr:transposase [Planctomycetota bacterium]